jgi:signal transduction histidine kinase
VRALLRSIHDELIRLSSIVDSLMILVKSDTGRLTFAMQPLAIDELIRQSFEEAKVLAGRKKIRVELEESDTIRVSGDAARLKQLFLNLIDNAIKYTRPHGLITLSLAAENGFVAISVKDNGIGIARKDLAKIFERFHRGEHNKRNGEKSEGSGLGLSIAKWIAEAHCGGIEVRSREGRGSTFIVRLPILL